MPGGDDYTAVLYGNGHVVGYTLNFRDQTISEARAQVQHEELPHGTRQLWFLDKGACALQMFTSPTL